MDLDAALWSGLPFEIVEQVLSFVRVPDLCRYRSVCKTWNRLICNPKFAAQNAQNAAKRRDVSFIEMHYRHDFDPQPSGKSTHGWYMLDLNSRHWYTGQFNAGCNDSDCCRICYDVEGMDGGLICRLLKTKSRANSIIVHSLIGNSAKVVPTAPLHLTSEIYPALNIVVDSSSLNFKIFLINHGFDMEFLEDPRTTLQDRSLILNDPLMRVYGSATNEWKSMTNPSWINRGVGKVMSSVMFQGLLYVLFFGDEEHSLRRYNLLEDAWENVAVPFPDGLFLEHELVVSANRLFQVAWYSNLFSSNLDVEFGNLDPWFFEVNEINFLDNTREPLLELPKADVVRLFAAEFKYPRLRVFGFGNSLMILSNSSGISMAFDVVTRKWDREWPQIPLRGLPEGRCSWIGKHMNLLLPSTPW